jgi:peroxiredoxin family protein
MSRRDPEATRRLAIIASKGTLDFAYPPFILGSTAAAMGWEVAIFFAFYGLPLLLRNYDPKVSPLGNPAMPL